MKDKLSWEETIQYIREAPEYKELVEQAYFDEDLQLNVKRFRSTKEYSATLELIKHYAPKAKTILDIGCGNGISTINLAKEGYSVTAVEPDPSNTIGAGAIRKLASDLDITNIQVFESLAEDISFDSNSFDVVYFRQAMHHASNLKQFVGEALRVLKPEGLLLTVRDHVIYNDKDKDWFLKSHPLHKFYGGENAFTAKEYRNAIVNSGAEIIHEFKYYDSPINYFPLDQNDLDDIKKKKRIYYKNELKKKIGFLAEFEWILNIYLKRKSIQLLDERDIPGRMYTYVAIKSLSS